MGARREAQLAEGVAATWCEPGRPMCAHGARNVAELVTSGRVMVTYRRQMIAAMCVSGPLAGPRDPWLAGRGKLWLAIFCI